jgi:hypothetical protein
VRIGRVHDQGRKAMPKKPVPGKKKVPQGDQMKASEGFNAAMEDALKNADDEWGAGRTDATVELRVNVETRSPGLIHEYKVILNPIS